MKWMISLVFCAASLSGMSQAGEDCKLFHEGTFVYQDTLEGVYVIRTASQQIEIDENDKTVSIAAVEWMQDCNYDLTFTNLPKGDKFLHGKTLRCFINEVYEDGYLYTARMKGVATQAVLVRYDGEVPDYSKFDGVD